MVSDTKSIIRFYGYYANPLLELAPARGVGPARRSLVT
jgi:hypothetical protein